MARPRIYKTNEARLAAMRESRRNYYARNRDKINAKRRGQCAQMDQEKDADWDSFEPTLAECLRIVKEAKDDFVKLTGSTRAFTERVLSQYVASFPLDDSDNENDGQGDLQIIERALAEVQEIHRRVHRGQDAIYHRCGVCPEWHASEQVCRSVRLVIVCLEDILCLAMQGASTLAEADFLGQLMYKQYP